MLGDARSPQHHRHLVLLCFAVLCCAVAQHLACWTAAAHVRHCDSSSWGQLVLLCCSCMLLPLWDVLLGCTTAMRYWDALLGCIIGVHYWDAPSFVAC